MDRHWRWLAAGLALAGCRPDPGASAAITVEEIVDGDTIDVRVAGRTERVRLTGIDTPELAHEPGEVAECFATEASEFVVELLPIGTAVRLERDVVGRDDYGRLLAYVFRSEDGVFVNREIVRHGYALPLSIPPNDTFAEVVVDAARAAQREGTGLWSACQG